MTSSVTKRVTRAALRILHIEDSPADSELIQAMLEGDGVRAEIDRVETAEATRGAMERGGIDLVISDFALPAFNGLEALELATTLLPGVPFILVSGTIGEEAAIDSLRSGATDYVLKHRLSRLAPAVRRALHEAEDRRVLAEAVAALERERRFLRAVLESVRTGIMACDAGGTLTLVNRAARKIHGLPEDATLERLGTEKVWLLDAAGGARIARLDLPLQRVMGGEGLADTELIVAPSGQPRRNVVLSGREVVDENGACLGAVAAIHDVSEQRELIEQLRHAQKLEAIGRLVDGTAREFNNILTTILGYAQLAARRVAGDAEAASDLVEIERAAERGASLTTQLRSLGARQGARPRPLELGNALLDQQDMLRRLAGDHVELTVTVADAVQVHADPSQIEQLVMNLVSNARDAIVDAGHLWITIAENELDAEAAARFGLSRGGFAELTIRDDGAGMDEATRTRVFEPFFTTKSTRGSGLGLSTVFGIVRELGGAIALESKPGAGTTVRVLLPRLEAKPSPALVPRVPSSPHRGSQRILVLEEDSLVRGVMVRALRIHGYTVIEAHDGAAALSAVEANAGGQVPLDLLLTDVMVPSVGVSEMVSRLRAATPPVRVLFLSARADHALLADDPQGADAAFLPKPFTMDQLIGKVREILRRQEDEAA